MKVQIDTKAKVIRIEETINLGEMCKVLDKLLPKEWKNYSLETGSIIFWTNPIPWDPYNPWVIKPPYIITCRNNTGTLPPKNPYNVTCEVYNVEVLN
jgi:hypothetical protein